MEIEKMEVGQQVRGKTGALLTIIGKEPDKVQVRNEKGKEYFLPGDYDPEEKEMSEKELKSLTKTAIESGPFAHPVITKKPRNNGYRVAVPKHPRVRERFLELLRAGCTRAEVNEKMKDTSIPILFNYSLERLEERGITIQRPDDKKTGKYYATGQFMSKRTAGLREHPAIAKLGKKSKRNLR